MPRRKPKFVWRTFWLAVAEFIEHVEGTHHHHHHHHRRHLAYVTLTLKETTSCP